MVQVEVCDEEQSEESVVDRQSGTGNAGQHASCAEGENIVC